MKICLSFDDGRSDAYEAYKILMEHNLVASFHVTTGFIDGSFVTDSFGKGRKPFTKEQIKEMFDNGMDISSHGDKHILDSEDYRISINKLRQFGVNEKRIGFSVPNSEYSEEELSIFIKDNIDSIDYVRVGRDRRCYSFLSKFNYVLYHLTKFQCFYNGFNKFNLINDIDRYKLPSLVVKKDVKVKNLINFIDKYKNNDCSLVIMFHSIVEKPSNKWEYNIDDFRKLCVFLKDSNIQAVTLNKLVNEGE